jgi:1,4-alpha-glucan branching enzyme
VSKFNSNAKVYSDVFDGVDVPEWFDAVEDDYDGQPASVTLALPPYSAVIVSRA